METYGIALFYNTKDAMQAEAEARRRQIKARIVPTPGKIYASCGFSLRYDLKEEGHCWRNAAFPARACIMPRGTD